VDAIFDFMGLGESPAERGRLTTILFTDLVGHTEMMQRLGDAKGRDVLREHERITREVLKAHGGTEVKTMGDGFLASFGSVTKAVEWRDSSSEGVR
jgi:class 3 adenylate cyclase